MAHILIVDDDRVSRLVLRTALAGAGYHITEADNGHSAMDVMHTRPADLVVTDLYMPGKDGIETIRHLRREFPDVPIIAVTGCSGGSDQGYIKAARAAGARRTFTKPVNAEKVTTAIETLLRPEVKRVA